MRAIAFVLCHGVALIATLSACFPAHAENSPAPAADIRNIDQLVFEGIEGIDVADIRSALEFDFDLLMAAHPQSELEAYLAKLEVTVQNGYLYSGFPDARVEVVYSKARRRIEVHVQEGPRFRSGDVHVSGAREVPADVIIRALTEDPKPSLILWKRDRPARFDDQTAREIRHEVEYRFAAAGYFHPEFETRIVRDADGKTATLIVTISDEGPHSIVGGIKVTGTKRDSRADVLKYLDLRPGMAFNNGTATRLKQRLTESGRYLAVDVSEEKASFRDASGRSKHNLLINLRDYKQAAPLASDFPPAEEALLKFRDWLARWAKGEVEEDIVLRATFDEELPEALQTWFNGRQPVAALPRKVSIDLGVIVAPNRGQTIVVRAAPTGGESLLDVAFAAYPDRLVLADLERNAKLILSNSMEKRLVLKATGERVKTSDDEKPFGIFFGMGWSAKSKPDPTPFEVQVNFSAAFIISLAHLDGAKATIDEHRVKLANESFLIEIERASGRLVKYRWKSAHGESLTCRCEHNALAGELQRLNGPLATAREIYDTHSPWKSLGEFFVDEWVAVARGVGSREGNETMQALRKLCKLWTAPAIADLLEPWDKLSPKTDDAFRIPWHYPLRTGTERSPTGTRASQNIAARTVLPIYRQLVPATGWMWPVGRDAALSYVSGDGLPGTRVKDAVASGEVGPFGKILLGFAGPYLGIPAAAFAGENGVTQLTTAAFRIDYEPLLAGDSWLGEWFLSLAEALRGLDESELQALSRFFPEDGLRAAVFKELRLLASRPQEPIEDVLPKVLDFLWNDVLRDCLDKALTKTPPSRVARQGRTHVDEQVRPAAGKSRKQNPEIRIRPTE